MHCTKIMKIEGSEFQFKKKFSFLAQMSENCEYYCVVKMTFDAINPSFFPRNTQMKFYDSESLLAPWWGLECFLLYIYILYIYIYILMLDCWRTSIAPPTPEWRWLSHQPSVTGGRIHSVQWEVLMVGRLFQFYRHHAYPSAKHLFWLTVSYLLYHL